MNRIFMGILGVSLLVVGVHAAADREHYSSFYGRVIDYGEYHAVVGAVIIALGVACLWSASRRSRE